MFWYNPYENRLVSMLIKQKSKIYTKFMKINDIHQGFLIVIIGLFLAFLDFFSFLDEISCTFVPEYQKPHFRYFFHKDFIFPP